MQRSIADGAASQGPQTFTMNITSLPEGGANYRVFKTTANGSSFFGNATALTLGENTVTVGSVGFDRAVKFFAALQHQVVMLYLTH